MGSLGSAGVALVGCGTVGSAVARLLCGQGELLRRRGGVCLELRHVVDQDFARARRAGVAEKLFRSDLSQALGDAGTQTIIELVGGTTVAKEIVERALKAGKHVVTANKALLAHHGNELFALARKHGACIGFEASCVGGVPVIGSLLNGLIANDIDALYGIVNGTCNYILTAMTERGAGYAQVLAEAQRAGLAEADPSLDVQGTDSAHKLAILSALAFGQRIDLAAVAVEGIDRLDQADIRYGMELGYRVKLLAIGERQAEGVSLRVHPAFLPHEHPLAKVSGPFNALSVFGHVSGHTMYYGRGAGGPATASAVVADLFDVALGNAQRRFEALGIWPDRAPAGRPVPMELVRGRYYLRVMCQDAPGVLAQIAAALGRGQISISSVLQHEPSGDAGGGVPVVITTHEALEGNLRRARDEIDRLPAVKAPTVCIRIMDEHEESPSVEGKP